jgi:hypothetical protein
VELSVEEYQPLGLSEDEAIRLTIEGSELLELGHLVGLGAQLQASASTSRASASTSRAAPLPPPLHRQRPSPSLKQAGHGVWESALHAPSIQVNWGPWGYAEP